MKIKRTFPSPYGVTVIKSQKKNLESQKKCLFPSPYGVTVIKSPEYFKLIGNFVALFPSPYGVTVIKSLSSVITITMRFI